MMDEIEFVPSAKLLELKAKLDECMESEESTDIERSEAFESLGIAQFYCGEYLDSVSNLELSICEEYVELKNGDRLSYIRILLASLYYRFGDPNRSEACLMLACDDAKNCNDSKLYTIALSNLAIIKMHLGKAKEAVKIAKTSLEYTENSSGRLSQTYFQQLRVLLSIFIKNEDYSKAEAILDENEFPPREKALLSAGLKYAVGDYTSANNILLLCVQNGLKLSRSNEKAVYADSSVVPTSADKNGAESDAVDAAAATAITESNSANDDTNSSELLPKHSASFEESQRWNNDNHNNSNVGGGNSSNLENFQEEMLHAMIIYNISMLRAARTNNSIVLNNLPDPAVLMEDYCQRFIARRKHVNTIAAANAAIRKANAEAARIAAAANISNAIAARSAAKAARLEAAAANALAAISSSVASSTASIATQDSSSDGSGQQPITINKRAPIYPVLTLPATSLKCQYDPYTNLSVNQHPDFLSFDSYMCPAVTLSLLLTSQAENTLLFTPFTAGMSIESGNFLGGDSIDSGSITVAMRKIQQQFRYSLKTLQTALKLPSLPAIDNNTSLLYSYRNPVRNKIQSSTSFSSSSMVQFNDDSNSRFAGIAMNDSSFSNHGGAVGGGMLTLDEYDFAGPSTSSTTTGIIGREGKLNKQLLPPLAAATITVAEAGGDALLRRGGGGGGERKRGGEAVDATAATTTVRGKGAAAVLPQEKLLSKLASYGSFSANNNYSCSSESKLQLADIAMMKEALSRYEELQGFDCNIESGAETTSTAAVQRLKDVHKVYVSEVTGQLYQPPTAAELAAAAADAAAASAAATKAKSSKKNYNASPPKTPNRNKSDNNLTSTTTTTTGAKNKSNVGAVGGATTTGVRPDSGNKIEVVAGDDDEEDEDSGTYRPTAPPLPNELTHYSPDTHDASSIRAEIIPLLSSFGRDEASAWIEWALANAGPYSFGFLGQSCLDPLPDIGFGQQGNSSNDTTSSPPAAVTTTTTTKANAMKTKAVANESKLQLQQQQLQQQQQTLAKKEFLIEVRNRLLELEVALSSQNKKDDEKVVSSAAAFTAMSSRYVNVVARVLNFFVLCKVTVQLNMKVEVGLHILQLEEACKNLKRQQCNSIDSLTYYALCLRYKLEYEEWCVPALVSDAWLLNHYVNKMLPIGKEYHTVADQISDVVLQRDALKKLINIYIEVTKIPYHGVVVGDDDSSTGSSSYNSGGSSNVHTSPSKHRQLSKSRQSMASAAATASTAADAEGSTIEWVQKNGKNKALELLKQMKNLADTTLLI